MPRLDQNSQPTHNLEAEYVMVQPLSRLTYDLKLQDRLSRFGLALLCSAFLSAGTLAFESSDGEIKHGVASLPGEQAIAYSVRGKGSPLVFIHGWSMDSRVWLNQIAHFSKSHRVITIDLEGHGHSSRNRGNYTMPLYAQDIKAVLDQEHIENAVLIGHSMGGAVIAEAAKLMPDRISAIIGIDTLHDVAAPLEQSELNAMVQPFELDFPLAMLEFVRDSLPPNANTELVGWVTTDMASAPRDAAINQFRNYMNQYVTGEAADVFTFVDVPVVLINAQIWPTATESNSQLIKQYSDVFIDGTGHFPMIERPEAFNNLLEQVLDSIENEEPFQQNTNRPTKR